MGITIDGKSKYPQLVVVFIVTLLRVKLLNIFGSVIVKYTSDTSWLHPTGVGHGGKV